MRMQGWKTWVGGIGFICTGVGTIISAVNFETWVFDGDQLTTGVGMVFAGFAAIGLGHKVEKGQIQ